MPETSSILVVEGPCDGKSSVTDALLRAGYPCTRIQEIENAADLIGCIENGEHRCTVVVAGDYSQLTEQLLDISIDCLPQSPILLLTETPDLSRQWTDIHFGQIDVVFWDGSSTAVLEKSVKACCFVNEAIQRERQYKNNVLVGRRLLTLIGHELRVPLETLRYTQQQLCQIEMDEKAKTLAAHCRRVASYMCEYVGNIVEFARIEKDEDTNFKEEFCIETLVRECFDLLWSHAHSKGVELILLPIPGGTIHFFGDRKKIRQVLINIISNAIRYTGEGKITVSIRPDDGLAVEVNDTGVGMSPARLQEVFVDDHSGVVSASGAIHSGGLGIGVALCKKLTQSLQGQLTAESRANGGTKVKMWFPGAIVLKSHPRSVNSSNLQEKAS